MNPFERKVVHDAIAAIDGVRSESEGEEPNRRVVVLLDAAERGDALRRRRAGSPDRPPAAAAVRRRSLTAPSGTPSCWSTAA